MQRQRRGFTLIELMIVIAIAGIILAIAIPNFTRSRDIAPETTVIREIQTIYEAQTQFKSQFGGYAATLAQLGPGPENGNSIPASLASGEKDGYVFEMTQTPGGFAVTAIPKVHGTTGRRSFYLDENGVVRQSWGPEAATASSEEIR